ncbi:YhhN-like protein-domain-containing protein [Panaeolus papilionaceus]|nr:YhhN-like protein-domain-containing protein [Panaeolus papilionaceus]
MVLHLPDPPFPISLAASLVLLIISEANSFYPGSAGFKIAASLSFLGAGINAASTKLPSWYWSSILQPENRYTAALVFGLAFGVVGDVLLIPSKANYFKTNKSRASEKPEGQTARFKAGVFFFALAHIAYIVAFISKLPAGGFRWVDGGLALAFGGILTTWLGVLNTKPTPGARFLVPEDMFGLVTAYIVIIMSMVASATATDEGWQRIIGAWAFMISDIFVAADTFAPKKKEEKKTENNNKKGREGWKARSVGWTAYFGAQLVLAGCI